MVKIPLVCFLLLCLYFSRSLSLSFPFFLSSFSFLSRILSFFFSPFLWFFLFSFTFFFLLSLFLPNLCSHSLSHLRFPFPVVSSPPLIYVVSSLPLFLSSSSLCFLSFLNSLVSLPSCVLLHYILLFILYNLFLHCHCSWCPVRLFASLHLSQARITLVMFLLTLCEESVRQRVCHHFFHRM